jgi:hypothetical protein
MWPFDKKEKQNNSSKENKIFVSEDILSTLSNLQYQDRLETETKEQKQKRLSLEFAINFPIPEIYKKYVVPNISTSCYLIIDKLKIAMYYDTYQKPEYMVLNYGKYYSGYETFNSIDNAIKYATRGKTIVAKP